ncbi:flagellar protein FlgN [Nocardioides sp. TF02-7]|uniref:flagellar protein FlgN n=1 Tax=Nocardioides sp. TF02-7 TaxID=2917724 RepID=UPI001F06DF5E|nr:flagellar protein FlgN [Nocardioides sp. TF02-7]UMG92947.1 flagellar protein FlgN [Nocardioides sp. TF02-7]
MEKLSLILWRERELMEQLSFKLEVERLVLASGRTRWLAAATREIEDVLATIRETEVLRAVAADEAAAELGLPPDPSLAALAAAAPEPWQGLLLDHRDAFVAMAREIAELSEQNKGLLTAGYRSARATLSSITGTGTDGYAEDGSAVVDAPRSGFLDKAL